MGSREWGVGNAELGVGSGEWGVGNAECAMFKDSVQSMTAARIRNLHPILQISIPSSPLCIPHSPLPTPHSPFISFPTDLKHKPPDWPSTQRASCRPG